MLNSRKYRGCGTASRIVWIISWVLFAVASVWIYYEVKIAAANEQGAKQKATQKKLIEFGGGEPDTAFMRQHIAEMEQTPFDGCVFHINLVRADGSKQASMWQFWGKQSFTEAELKSGLEDLQATPFQRFTHNFLRLNMCPGDVEWFDDFSAILNNARLVASVAYQGKCKGILFDTEAYNQQTEIFDYRRRPDAAERSWDEYAGQARRRGREVMEAFQQGFPDVTVFLTFGHSLAWEQSLSWWGGRKPLSECQYGLLAAFLDGMVESAKGNAQLVDGYEHAYGFRNTSRFAAAYQTMKKGVLPIVADPKKYEQVVSFGFGIWLDYKYLFHTWNIQHVKRNFYTPEQFEASVRKALEISDEYVWIYSETPRWWSAEGKPVDLPEAYDTALRRARKGLTAD